MGGYHVSTSTLLLCERPLSFDFPRDVVETTTHPGSLWGGLANFDEIGVNTSAL